jgi:hypothetical protein
MNNINTTDYYIKKLNIITKNKINLYIDELNIKKESDGINVLLLREPNDITNFLKKKDIRKYLQENQDDFDYIITFDKELLKIKKSKKLLFGTTWIEEKYWDIKYKKKPIISTIIGGKNWIEGHKLRHKIYYIDDKINIKKEIYLSSNFRGHLIKKSYHKILGKELDSKIRCFENCMFHLCIENTKQDNYFSEKLMDCFMTKTVPIYWGCPNIGDYFDTRGMIILDTDNEYKIISIINRLTEKDFISRKKYILDNLETAKKFVDYNERLCKIIKEIDEEYS